MPALSGPPQPQPPSEQHAQVRSDVSHQHGQPCSLKRKVPSPSWPVTAHEMPGVAATQSVAVPVALAPTTEIVSPSADTVTVSDATFP